MEQHGCLAKASFFFDLTHPSFTPGTITVDSDAFVVLLAVVDEGKATGSLTVQAGATWSDLNSTGTTKNCLSFNPLIFVNIFDLEY